MPGFTVSIPFSGGTLAAAATHLIQVVKLLAALRTNACDVGESVFLVRDVGGGAVRVYR